MALKKIRFVWLTPPLPEGRWRLGLFNLQRLPDPLRPHPAGGVPAYWKGYLHHTLHLSTRGLLAWGAVVGACAYLAGAAILLARYEHANPHNRIGYLDLVFPSRWGQRERLQGEGFILLAREKLADGRFSEGLALLRAGVDKNPADPAARLDLARLYIAVRLRPQGEKILREGLAHGYPGREYLETAFALATDADNPAEWVGLCELARARLDAVPDHSRPAGDDLWLDQQTVKALLSAARSADALAFVSSRYPEPAPFRREIEVLARLDAHDTQTAVALASRWADEDPRVPEPLRLLVRAQREAGDFVGMEAALGRLRALAPAKPDALLYSLAQNQLAGRTAAALAAKDELLFRHGADAAVYGPLSAILVEVKLANELPSLAREMRERGLSPRPVLMAQLQAEIANHAWTAALATAEGIRKSPGRALTNAQSVWLETMLRLVHACEDASSASQSALVETIAEHPGTFRLYRLVLDSLLASDRVETAARVLALAEGPYPAARGLTERRATIESRQAALAASRPPAAEPGASNLEHKALASPEALASAFAACIDKKDTPAALALLSAARRAGPAWLSGAEHRLDTLELPVRARGDDPLRLRLLARNTLGHDPRASEVLLALAQSVHKEGHPANAILLVKEILRRDPGHSEALARLAEWNPIDSRQLIDVRP